MQNRSFMTGLCILLLHTYVIYGYGNDKSFTRNDIKTDFRVDTSQIKNQLKDYMYLVENDYDSSQVVLKTISDEINTLNNNYLKFKVEILSYLLQSEVKARNISFIDSTSRELMNWVTGRKDSSLYQVAYNAKATVLKLTGRYDSAIIVFDIARKYALMNNDNKVLLGTLLNSGILYAMTGNYDDSERYFKEGLKICKENENFQGYSDFAQSLGIVYRRTGRITNALEMYKESMMTLEKIHSKSSYPEVLNNLATIYMSLGVDSVAIHYFEKSVEVAREQNSVTILTIGLSNLASFELKNGDDSLAYEYVMEALELVDKSKNDFVKLTLLSVLGDYYRLNEDYVRAKNNYLKSLRLGMKNSNADNTASQCQKLATMYKHFGQYDSMRYYSQMGLDIAKSSGLSEYVYQSARNLAFYYNMTGANTKAIDYYEFADSSMKAYYDSLIVDNNRNFAYRYELEQKESENKILENEAQLQALEIENTRNELRVKNFLIIIFLLAGSALLIIVLMFVVETRKKSKLNKLLEEKNTQILAANEDLRKENDFKNKLFSLVSHDVKSPIIGINSMLQVLAMADIPEKKRKEMEGELIQKTNNTLGLIENILFWTRNQMKGLNIEFSELELKKLVVGIIDNHSLEFEKKNIQTEVTIEESMKANSDSNIVHLVVRNLITNAIKFTPSGGRITIFAEHNQERVVLSVQDTGVGIPEDARDKILKSNEQYTTKGIRHEKGHGLGLGLCLNFSEKIGGRLWFESEVGKGTTFYFSIPSHSK